MSIRELFAGEGWFMRAVFGVALLGAALHALNLIADAILGLLGKGWDATGMHISLLAIVFVGQWGAARYWRRRALAAESRSVDVATVQPGTINIPAGAASEFAAAIERAQARRAASRDYFGR